MVPCRWPLQSTHVAPGFINERVAKLRSAFHTVKGNYIIMYIQAVYQRANSVNIYPAHGTLIPVPVYYRFKKWFRPRNI